MDDGARVRRGFIAKSSSISISVEMDCLFEPPCDEGLSLLQRLECEFNYDVRISLPLSRLRVMTA